MNVKYFFRFHKTLFNDCNGANEQIIIFPNLQYYGKFDAFDSYDFSIHLVFPLCNSHFPFTLFFPGHFDPSLREAGAWRDTECPGTSNRFFPLIFNPSVDGQVLQ